MCPRNTHQQQTLGEKFVCKQLKTHDPASFDQHIFNLIFFLIMYSIKIIPYIVYYYLQIILNRF